MATTIEIDVSGIKQFAEGLAKIPSDAFKKEAQRWLEDIGTDFLRMVQDEIKSRNVMDSRLLLISFQKGDAGNIWEMSEDGFTLEVGTNVSYAEYAEYGHHQRPGRFIPGYWRGDRFVYEPGAKEGMVLKAEWVPGKHYFNGALHALEAMFPGYLEAKVDEWLEKYLNF